MLAKLSGDWVFRAQVRPSSNQAHSDQAFIHQGLQTLRHLRLPQLLQRQPGLLAQTQLGGLGGLQRESPSNSSISFSTGISRSR